MAALRLAFLFSNTERWEAALSAGVSLSAASAFCNETGDRSSIDLAGELSYLCHGLLV